MSLSSALRAVSRRLPALLATGFLALSATASAGAAMPACEGGANLLERLAQEDPGAHGQVLQAAAAEPDGEGVFWKVEKPDAPPSWLFGTFHFPHERVDPAPSGVVEVLANARVMLMETTVEEAARFSRVIAARPDLMLETEDPPLDERLGPDRFAALAEAMLAYGLSPEQTARMRPWFLAMMLSVPRCALAAGGSTMDAGLAARAREAGVPVKGLETVESLLPLMMEGEDEPGALAALVWSAEQSGREADLLRTAAAAYNEGRIWKLWHWSALEAERAGYGARMDAARDALLDRRNAAFFEAAAAEFAEGGVFAAVGALHLGGEGGLVGRLRDAGYSVERRPVR
jgi:hypothetical protein